MHLTKDQVKKVAKLANLPISDGDEEKYSKQLSKILDYIDQLNKVDTKNIKPTYNVSGKNSVQATDVVESSLSQEETLQNTSHKRDGYFVTKGVFEE
jgi:aspartyl-tRNA(Asn)/glutamyl-tRNA(Gln) amidotransferase subunit C